MKWLPLLFLAGAAHAQIAVTPPPHYLVLPDLKTALARSQQQCAAMGCDGVGTIYWWNVVPLKDGTAAVEIQPSGLFSAQVSAGKGLTAAEALRLTSASTLALLLPAVIP